jgi:apolipoprotein D and lipocalin family protein
MRNKGIRKVAATCSILALMVWGSCRLYTDLETAPHTVDQVDLNRYVGKWYEIASFPAPFQKDCYCSRALYASTDEGMKVVNVCRRGSPTGPLDVAQATAYPVPETGNAQLKVQFLWPFKGDYWIIGLDPDYRWAVVGHPDRKYLWILSRSPTMDEGTYQSLVELSHSKGYQVETLQRMVQTCAE